MKFAAAAKRIYSGLFQPKQATASADPDKGKKKKIALIVGLIITGILIIVGLALILRYFKKRRTEKETVQALEDYYSTEYDADDYGYGYDEE